MNPSGFDVATPELTRYLVFVTSRHGDVSWVADGRTWQRRPDGRWVARVVIPEPEVDTREIDRVMSIGKTLVEAQAKGPTWDDLQQDRVLGKKLTLGEADGDSREGRFTNLTADDKKRLMEMDLEAVGAHAEVSDMRSETTEFVTLKGNGVKKTVPVEVADKIARRDGLRPVRVKAR